MHFYFPKNCLMFCFLCCSIFQRDVCFEVLLLYTLYFPSSLEPLDLNTSEMIPCSARMHYLFYWHTIKKMGMYRVVTFFSCSTAMVLIPGLNINFLKWLPTGQTGMGFWLPHNTRRLPSLLAFIITKLLLI